MKPDVRSNLLVIARRGLPSALGAVCLLEIQQLVMAYVEDPGLLAEISGPILAALALIVVLQAMGVACAILRPRLAVWALLGVVTVQLVLLLAGDVALQEYARQPYFRIGLLDRLAVSLISVALAYALRWATPRESADTLNC